jgi:hypothetical protein
MFGAEPRTILTAIGYFGDGDVAEIPRDDMDILLDARDHVRDLPHMSSNRGSLAVPVGPCTA